MFSYRIIWKYSLYHISLHRVFHGIRFKVNKDWDSAEPLFYAPTFQGLLCNFKSVYPILREMKKLQWLHQLQEY